MDRTTAQTDPRVDAYIAQAAPFARPILAHLRHVVHAACPDIAEDIKWRMPFFVHRGPVCHIAAFKSHCAMGFWRGAEIPELESGVDEKAMGHLGRILSLDDLPSKRRLTAFVKAAIRLDEGDARPVRATKTKDTIAVPDDFAVALAAHRDASRHFDAIAPGARRDYLEWILGAKRDATRASRIATAVTWLSEGKTRNWKYELVVGRMRMNALGVVALVAILAVAALHAWFMVLEMFLWTKPAGRRAFGLAPEFAEATKSLAANQGLYNGFLVAGLVWGAVATVQGASLAFPVTAFFLACVIVAGVFGAVTVSRRILFVQAVPALLALALVWLANHH